MPSSDPGVHSTKERSEVSLDTNGKKNWAQVNAVTLDVVELEEKEKAPTQIQTPDFPDGGLRAWLIVVGVRLSLYCFPVTWN